MVYLVAEKTAKRHELFWRREFQQEVDEHGKPRCAFAFCFGSGASVLMREVCCHPGNAAHEDEEASSSGDAEERTHRSQILNQLTKTILRARAAANCLIRDRENSSAALVLWRRKFPPEADEHGKLSFALLCHMASLIRYAIVFLRCVYDVVFSLEEGDIFGSISHRKLHHVICTYRICCFLYCLLLEHVHSQAAQDNGKRAHGAMQRSARTVSIIYISTKTIIRASVAADGVYLVKAPRGLSGISFLPCQSPTLRSTGSSHLLCFAMC